MDDRKGDVPAMATRLYRIEKELDEIGEDCCPDVLAASLGVVVVGVRNLRTLCERGEVKDCGCLAVKGQRCPMHGEF